MAAEIYVTILTGFGLGHLLHYGRELNAMDQVIGIMLVIVVIGLLADKILFSPWERFLHRRWERDGFNDRWRTMSIFARSFATLHQFGSSFRLLHVG
jgi:hypothetical protein